MVERLNFKIRAEASEKCAIIRMSPRLYAGNKAPLRKVLDLTISEEVRDKTFRQGLMICTGIVSKIPIEMTESYFIFNQRTFNSQAVDANSDSGRSLFISLRGFTEYKKFLNLLGGKLVIPDSAEAEEHVNQMLNDNTEADFLKGSSSAPGVFTADN